MPPHIESQRIQKSYSISLQPIERPTDKTENTKKSTNLTHEMHDFHGEYIKPSLERIPSIKKPGGGDIGEIEDGDWFCRHQTIICEKISYDAIDINWSKKAFSKNYIWCIYLYLAIMIDSLDDIMIDSSENNFKPLDVMEQHEDYDSIKPAYPMAAAA